MTPQAGPGVPDGSVASVAATAAAAVADAADPGWRHVRRLLAVRLDGMGDLLMTTPALTAVRASAPSAHLTLLSSPAAGAPLGRGERALVEQLAAGAFDAAIIFTVATQSALPAALVCRMAGIPLRLAHARENPYGLLSDWVHDGDVVADGMRHEVQRQLELVRRLGWTTPDTRLQMCPSAAAREVARVQLLAAGLRPGEPYVVVHVGASAPSRR